MPTGHEGILQDYAVAASDVSAAIADVWPEPVDRPRRAVKHSP